MITRAVLYGLLVVCLVGIFWLGGSQVKADMCLLVGSRNSHIYHLDTCEAARRIKQENLIIFATPEKAKGAGYRPCKICNPPEETSKVKEV